MNGGNESCFCRSLQTELVSSVLLQMFQIYKTNLDSGGSNVTQAVAMQYLFDAWYLSGLLVWRDSDKVSILGKVK